MCRPGKIGPGPINPSEPRGKIWVWVRDFRTRQRTGQPEPDPFKNGLGRVDPFCRFFYFCFFFYFSAPPPLQQLCNCILPPPLQRRRFVRFCFYFFFFFFKGALEQPYIYIYISIYQYHIFIFIAVLTSFCKVLFLLFFFTTQSFL
jgi:hypothetical protein